MGRPSYWKLENDKCIRLYNYLAAHYFKFGYMPSRRDLRKVIGHNSSATVNTYVHRLNQWGWISIAPHMARGMRLIRATEIDPTDEVKKVFIDNIDQFVAWEGDKLTNVKGFRGHKLTLEQIYSIKEKIASGQTLTSIAKEYEVDLSYISKIKSGKRHSSAPALC